MKKYLLILLSVLLFAAFALTPRAGSADLGDFSGGGDYGGGDYGGHGSNEDAGQAGGAGQWPPTLRSC